MSVAALTSAKSYFSHIIPIVYKVLKKVLVTALASIKGGCESSPRYLIC